MKNRFKVGDRVRVIYPSKVYGKRIPLGSEFVVLEERPHGSPGLLDIRLVEQPDDVWPSEWFELVTPAQPKKPATYMYAAIDYAEGRGVLYASKEDCLREEGQYTDEILKLKVVRAFRPKRKVRSK